MREAGDQRCHSSFAQIYNSVIKREVVIHVVTLLNLNSVSVPGRQFVVLMLNQEGALSTCYVLLLIFN